MKTKTTTIGIKVKQELREIFDKYAKAENRSLSNWIKNALHFYVKEKYGEDIDVRD